MHDNCAPNPTRFRSSPTQYKLCGMPARSCNSVSASKRCLWNSCCRVRINNGPLLHITIQTFPGPPGSQRSQPLSYETVLAKVSWNIGCLLSLLWLSHGLLRECYCRGNAWLTCAETWAFLNIKHACTCECAFHDLLLRKFYNTAPNQIIYTAK